MSRTAFHSGLLAACMIPKQRHIYVLVDVAAPPGGIKIVYLYFSRGESRMITLLIYLIILPIKLFFQLIIGFFKLIGILDIFSGWD